MVTRAPTTSGGHNEQGNDENETNRQTKQRHQSHARPQPGGEVGTLHPAPGADDDGEERQDAQRNDGANDGGEHTLETAGRWEVAL